MSTTIPAAAPVKPVAAPPAERRPNSVYALAQVFAGLLVPMWQLWLVRPWLAPESEAVVRARPTWWLTRLVTRFLGWVRVGVVAILALSPHTAAVLVVCKLLPRYRRVILIFWVAGGWLLTIALFAVVFALGLNNPQSLPKFDPFTWRVALFAVVRAVLGVIQLHAVLLVLDLLFWRSFPAVAEELRPFGAALKRRIAIERGFWRFVGTLFTIGFSVLPLTALLVALPAAAPNEAVLSDTVRPARSWWRRTARRVFAVFAGALVLIGLFAFSIELVSHLPLPERGQLAPLAKKVLSSSVVDTVLWDEVFEKRPKDWPEGQSWYTPRELLDKRKTLSESANKPNQDLAIRQKAEADLADIETQIEERKPISRKLRILLDPELSPWLAEPLWTLLPPALVEHWPFVLLFVYAADLGLLLMIGRVPLAYNFRYLWVRRRDTILTALAFTVVVALVVVLLAFVNGMYKLNESTGVPGNVLVLAEGSTDELFSNLGRADAENVEQIVVTADANGRPLKAPVTVARAVPGPDGKLIPIPPGSPKELPGAVFLASLETYLVMNQPVPAKEGEKPRRRFLQVRGMARAAVAAAVHNMDLHPGGKWFTDDGVHQESGGKYIPCVIGEGAASTMGPDVGKARLEAGDTFSLGDRDWLVLGVMKSQGTTFGSEIWTSANNVVVQASGKGNKATTLVLRMSENTDTAAKAAAHYLNNDYTQAKLKAFAEPDYYKELTKTNEQFLTWIVFLAVVMAVGGVFGVMNTMFASIAARIKEVGVLRILGFKRWQILISFMLESLAIAFVGGLVGCAVGSVANFFEASSTLSGGNGGGKSVALKLVVDYQTVAAGMLFTLVMGRLGGLVPALSAMRMEILDSLR